MSAPNLLRTAGALLALLMCTGCPDQKGASTLEKVESTPSAQLAATSVDCTEKTEVCARTREEHGAACLKMTEASAPQERSKNRACALKDFAAARAQLPPEAPNDLRLRAAVGLAEALVIDRDNAMDPQQRKDDISRLNQIVSELRQMPGGGGYAAYFAGNSALNGVLTGTVPESSACSTLESARTSVAAANAAGAQAVGTTAVIDLDRRLADLRGQIDAARRPPARNCG